MIAYHTTDPADGLAILALMQTAFAGMEGRIDPPSSLHDLSVQSMFKAGEVWAMGAPPVACMILSPRSKALYLGKLAVAPDHQARGLARTMVEAAKARAQVLGLPKLELQTRVELEENHAIFRALGFVETGRTAHAGYVRATSVTFELTV